ncbi:MAG TPA: hypothetical protein VL049_01565 [Candidatus Dormibacteraeota bacterium]|nr:hypothetical protein [Candidatus Dormibacteraeota bacterium]
MAAFLARALMGEGQWRRVFAELDLDGQARAAAEAQAIPVQDRLAWMAERTGREWTGAQLAHVEARTLVAIRRQLQARGLWLEP